MSLTSLFTYTFRKIQIAAMTALDIYRVDDQFLHQINGVGFILLNILISILFCFGFGFRLAGVWAA